MLHAWGRERSELREGLRLAGGLGLVRCPLFTLLVLFLLLCALVLRLLLCLLLCLGWHPLSGRPERVLVLLCLLVGLRRHPLSGGPACMGELLLLMLLRWRWLVSCELLLLEGVVDLL